MFKRSQLVVFMTMILTMGTMQSARAFSITYNRSYDGSRAYAYYQTESHTGYTWTPIISKFDRGGTRGLRRLLKSYYPDWTFKTSSRDLVQRHSLILG
jgi:hypothetical protein